MNSNSIFYNELQTWDWLINQSIQFNSFSMKSNHTNSNVFHTSMIPKHNFNSFQLMKELVCKWSYRVCILYWNMSVSWNVILERKQNCTSSFHQFSMTVQSYTCNSGQIPTLYIISSSSCSQTLIDQTEWIPWKNFHIQSVFHGHIKLDQN